MADPRSPYAAAIVGGVVFGCAKAWQCMCQRARRVALIERGQGQWVIASPASDT